MTEQQLFQIRMHYLRKSIYSMAMTFLKAVPLAVLIGVITKGVISYLKKNKQITIQPYKERAIIIFAVYISIMVQMTVLLRDIGSGCIIDLVPFNTPGGTMHIVLYSLANTVVFVPLGLLVPMVWDGKINFKRILIVGILSSLIIEITQLILQCGEFQTEDLLMNFIGTMIGYFIYKCEKKRKEKKKKSI